jgi:hypothetical protein
MPCHRFTVPTNLTKVPHTAAGSAAAPTLAALHQCTPQLAGGAPGTQQQQQCLTSHVCAVCSRIHHDAKRVALIIHLAAAAAAAAAAMCWVMSHTKTVHRMHTALLQSHMQPQCLVIHMVAAPAAVAAVFVLANRAIGAKHSFRLGSAHGAVGCHMHQLLPWLRQSILQIVL